MAGSKIPWFPLTEKTPGHWSSSPGHAQKTGRDVGEKETAEGVAWQIVGTSGQKPTTASPQKSPGTPKHMGSPLVVIFPS